MCSVVHQAGIDAPRYMRLAGHGRYCESVAARQERSIRECAPIGQRESRLRPEGFCDPVLSRGWDEFNPAFCNTIARAGVLRYLECKFAAKFDFMLLPQAAGAVRWRLGADEH